MGSTSAPDQPTNNTATDSSDHNSNASSSYFIKTVCLQDWWLIKAEKDFEGKRLAVAGLDSCLQQAVRKFSSAPILKRYDTFTLETADGICVCLNGFMDQVRMKENGFSSEVSKDFLLGFPPNWEAYAENCLGEGGFNSEEVPRSTTFGSDKLSTNSGSVDDFSEGLPSRNKKATSEERHDNSDKIGLSHKSCGEDIHICGSVSIVGPGKSDAHQVQFDAIENTPLSLHSGRKVIKSFEETSTSEGQTLRSMKRKLKYDQTCGNITSQAGGQNKNTNMVLRSSTRLGDAKQNDDLQIAVSKKETNAKKASKSRKSSKRKLTYDTESPKTPRIIEKTSFAFPESLSCKRSRSGRRLLPALEFWRNQSAVYNADGQITGIRDGLHGAEPSRVSRSEPQRKRRKLS